MNPDSTLYERLGGEAGIDSLVIAFYSRVMADPELAPFFRSASLDKLHAMQKDFFSMAFGGPVPYTGRPLSHVHHGRGITIQHFRRFVDHLLALLEGDGTSEEDVREIIARLNGHANEIVGVSY